MYLNFDVANRLPGDSGAEEQATFIDFSLAHRSHGNESSFITGRKAANAIDAAVSAALPLPSFSYGTR
ncbi:MAG: hypothetical protein WB523_21230, partial [Candidatus Sulfotelmatobacter sp.]